MKCTDMKMRNAEWLTPPRTPFIGRQGLGPRTPMRVHGGGGAQLPRVGDGTKSAAEGKGRHDAVERRFGIKYATGFFETI